MPPLAIIVPARLGSTRFPRKLLHPILGKPLILWTAERIRSVAPSLPLCFAVAESELADCLHAAGFNTVLTDPALPSGTDRLAVANESIRAAAVINIQADEPLTTPQHIEQLASLISSQTCDLATLVTPFTSAPDFLNPNRVKAILAHDGRALYFTRAPAPFPRDLSGTPTDEWVRSHPAYLHLGMYAYTAAFLAKFRSLPQGRLEQIEKLEQLRALEHGFTIRAAVTANHSIGVDAPEDVARVEPLLKST